MPAKLLRQLFAVCFGLISLPAIGLAADSVDFLRDVRPILAKNCFKCHGPDDAARQSGLRLDVREGAIAGADSGEKAIVPMRADASELVRRITSADAETVMPPPATKNILTDSQKDILRRWIAEGAEYKPHWSFAPPVRPALPAVKDFQWPRNALDYFVLSWLEKEGLAPSAEADRYQLVRRLYLDLIGIPPTPAEADAFVGDKAPDAYEKLVDRLLASPAYGERWARKWLDLARYADTNGYEKDRARSIWPYRDWVINALNADMPFDQFSIEQLAGDMLPNATLEQRVATGFHRNTMLNEEGGIDPLEFRYYAVVDRNNTTVTTWLGLTLGCAQCHTHKFDPIPHREYYSMLAYLNNADEPELPVPTPDMAARKAALDDRIAQLERDLPIKFRRGDQYQWQAITPQSAKSTGGATLELTDGGIVLAGGKSPDKDAYTVDFEADLSGVAALRLEALADEKLPSHGPGRTPHGNFVLTEFQLARAGQGDAFTPVKFASATADFTQDSFDPKGVLDGNPRTGWAIHGHGRWNIDRTAIVTLGEPLPANSAGRWRVTIEQNYGEGHTLGKFRLSIGKPKPSSGENTAPAAEFAKAFDDWQQKTAPQAVRWTLLKPTAATSDIPHLVVLDDASVLASGDQTKRDIYTVKFDALPAKVTALRLEVLADDRLPSGGPGRIFYEGPPGDFFLSRFSVSAGGTSLKISSAVHSFANAGNTAARAIDDDPQTGWSISGGQGKTHTAVFVLSEPLTSAAALEVQMLFERYYAAGLGRFRVSATDDPRAATNLAMPSDVNDALLTTAADRSPAVRERLAAYFASIAPELAAARAEIDALRKQLPTPPTTLVLRERPEENPRPTFRMHRGEFLQPKEKITPGVLSALGTSPADLPRDRLAFARWLVSGKNPLTARVTVNRHWASLFGRGIVRTTEDFGLQGDVPSHPELLDWLATEFVAQGWSVKNLHRLIVTSSTYRQSSRVTPALLTRDPQNVLLARGPRARLEAESVRDNVLAVSGLLSRKQGGPSVFPPQPAGITSEGTYGPLAWKLSAGEDRYRRGLYTFAKRTAPYAMFSAFDAPSGEACLARREVSNTPLQALVLLNDEVFVEASKALGQEFAAAPGDDAARLTSLFRRILARPPTAGELKLLVAFFAAQQSRLAAKEIDPAAIAGPGDNAPARAAWTIVARSLLNLDETLTKD